MCVYMCYLYLTCTVVCICVFVCFNIDVNDIQKSTAVDGLIWFMILNATFNNNSVISWRSVLLVDLLLILSYRQYCLFRNLATLRDQPCSYLS